MPKITAPTIAATVGTKTAAPSSMKDSLNAALWDIENQRREGKTDAHEALKATFDTVEKQRKAG